jgi:esterase
MFRMEERDCVVNGLRVHYLDWGGPPERSLLFLHGGALTAHTWDAVCETMCSRWRCIALDQRGHGESEWSPAMDYGLRAHVGDIAAFVDALALDQPVLVGQSMGAMNALAYAARYPERTGALVLVDVGATIRSGASRIAEFVLAPAELDSVEEFVARAHAFNRLRDPEALRTSLLHNLRRLPDGRLTWKYDRRHLTREWIDDLAARYLRLQEEAPRVTCPVLVIRGGLSDVIADEDAVALAGRFPDGRWTTVPAGGHTLQGDNPAGLVEALESFLDEVVCV